ncbi:hypothetical protein V6N13_034247 [Hibiscus sabdariffa]|uniref:GRF-type domain-containing protein n=1 Tax=Hibiscus sabdariffa TaxID=183260 RepID=A0ABR2F860_9ROSI
MEEPSAFPLCGCGFSAQLRTSWSNDNPGRRFFGCKNHGSLVHHACRYFSWFSAQLRTSWSNDNPGRRFFGCKNHGSLVHHACRYFSWFDPPMTPRARVVMVGLLKRIKTNEVQRRKERLCWVFILALCVVMIWFSKL